MFNAFFCSVYFCKNSYLIGSLAFVEGELRHIETDDPFEFQVSLDHAYNQKRYEAIGEVKSFTTFVLRLNCQANQANQPLLCSG